MNTQNDDARLRALIEQARRLVPYGAPVVALPSIRTLHTVSAAQGEMLPLLLASFAFTRPQFPGCVNMEKPRVLVVEGTLDEGHRADLVPVLERAAKDRVPLVVAAADYAGPILALLLINQMSETLPVVALAPPDPGDRSALSRLAVLAQAPSAVPVGDRLRIDRVGTVPRMLMTTRETVVLDGPGARPMALIHAGGETPEEARAAALRLRDLG
jgi:hypothetical protein